MAASLLRNNNNESNTPSFHKGVSDDTHNSRFIQFIQNSTVADVLNMVKPDQPYELFDLPLTATMEEAFDLLLKHDILSLPVYRLEDNNEKKYITFVSALDLLKLLSTKVNLPIKLFMHKIYPVIQSGFIHLIAITKEPLTVLALSDSLASLLNILSVQGTHRVLVKTPQQQHVVLSQMDLIRYFQASNHQLGSPILDMSVSEMKSSPVHTCLTYKSTAAKAFLTLTSDDSISALPLIDDTNQLVGDISAQDIRGLNKSRWSILSKPVMMFLKERYGDNEEDRPQLLTCHDKFTLSQVMSAFVLRRAHRLWWMDFETNELKGIITLTDILSTFAQVAAAVGVSF
ncbi:hypothetical protein BDF20DRAFT_826778 [Mycotypha africana]|uniref:uncharacterized protein n=1 Tax=Mycotypha africana TaxID=64632 RepID=UPI002300280E|nr:uncharacterized protein BDF20DRAFT_826778 [Mycotypha africana]KAI8969289.1 hypothetical protein BDF20DRAFT_826778 [Mycotypha africana]